MTQAPEPILRIKGLNKRFPLGGGFLTKPKLHVHAVNDVSFDVYPGEIFGLVGESGSGKSTIGRMIANLTAPTSGSMTFRGADLAGDVDRSLRRRISLVFQDPYASLNPRRSIAATLEAPMLFSGEGLNRAARRKRIEEVLETVGLPASAASRFPAEFSGGQRQRIGIARSLVTNPSFIIADEPVSALDVSVQAQVINLLLGIRDARGISMLFVAHDLSVVGYACDRIAVINLGRIVEIAPKAALFRNPRHPYTEALFESAPVPDPELRSRKHLVKGDIPSPIKPPPGCVFSSRCPYAKPECSVAAPPLRDFGGGHFSACIRDDLTLKPWAALEEAR